jgi:hypothetical protein
MKESGDQIASNHGQNEIKHNKTSYTGEANESEEGVYDYS